MGYDNDSSNFGPFVLFIHLSLLKTPILLRRASFDAPLSSFSSSFLHFSETHPSRDKVYVKMVFLLLSDKPTRTALFVCSLQSPLLWMERAQHWTNRCHIPRGDEAMGQGRETGSTSVY